MKIYDAITGISDEFVEEAINYKANTPNKTINWKQYTAMAASLGLVVGIGTYLWQNGGFQGASSGNGSGGSGNEIQSFMSYAGPVFPLTMEGENENISAIREINYDFSPYLPSEETQIWEDGSENVVSRSKKEAIITDTYLVENQGNQEETVTFRYPITATLKNEKNQLPTIQVDGKEVESHLRLGDSESYYEEDFPSSFYANSLEDYVAFLENGHIFSDTTGVSLDIPVTVHKFTDHQADFEEGTNPTLAVSATINTEKTVIFTHGFHGGSWNEDTGEQMNSYSIPEPDESGFEETRYYIVLGEEVDITAQGYQTGGYDPKDKIDSPTATIMREETTLSEVLQEIFAEMMRKDSYYTIPEEIFSLISQEQFLQLIANVLENYQMLQPEEGNYFQPGMLEELFTVVMSVNRLFYAEFEVSIPSGGSVEIVAQANKGASYNHYYKGSDITTNGFDLVPQLGSTLTFTEQSASIQTHDIVEIVGQNFGFDVKNGITSVELDLEAPYYYLYVALVEWENESE
ncbi:MAG: hypothetical protein R3Y07_03590 [Eubacteriales bacterium]